MEKTQALSVKLFCDSSMLIAGALSKHGASRVILESAQFHNWILFAAPYVLREVKRNLNNISAAALRDWAYLEGKLVIVPDVLTAGRITVFSAAKDKPILFTAFEHTEVLLTLDQGDFAQLGESFFGLDILSPGAFLEREKARGHFDPARWANRFS